MGYLVTHNDTKCQVLEPKAASPPKSASGLGISQGGVTTFRRGSPRVGGSAFLSQERFIDGTATHVRARIRPISPLEGLNDL